MFLRRCSVVQGQHSRSTAGNLVRYYTYVVCGAPQMRCTTTVLADPCDLYNTTNVVCVCREEAWRTSLQQRISPQVQADGGYLRIAQRFRHYL